MKTTHKSMKVYFAHPVTDYGTKQESDDIATLEKLGFTVVNPAGNEEGYKKDGMAFFHRMIDGCEAFAFRSFECGSIGAGVTSELAYAESLGLPFFELPYMDGSRSMSVEETRSMRDLVWGK